jgi:N-acetylglucosaminyl-diphospho-decaprenol L-rhamnosyltransferase
MSPAVGIEVLIPHHNGADSLGRTLTSLREQTLVAPVCVVDNASSDRTAAMLAEDYPEVRVMRMERNLGFGAALNRGVAESTARLVIFLNNDAVADGRFIERIDAAQHETGAEMIAACLRGSDGRVESIGVEMDTGLNAYDCRHGEHFGPEPSSAAPLGPTGGAAGYLKEAFEAVGGFDEALFAYLEDVDLAVRMRLAGYRCAVAADAFAWHRHSATLGARSERKNELLGFGRGYLLWKYGQSLGARGRLTAQLSDAVVYVGKAVIDRNLGAFRGRLRARRTLLARERPPQTALDRLPLLRLSPRQALARRLARRR